MLLVAGCALGVTAPARADVLLSNLGQAADAGKSSFYLAHAQGFRTGENSGGYTLTSVETDLYGLDTAELAKLTVSIHTANNSHSNSAHHGQPLTPSLGTLTNPASVPGGSTFKFTTPGIHLAAETWYSVVLKPVGYRGIWLLGDSEGAILTVSTSLDASSKTGWRIAQHSWTRNPHSAGWSTGRQFLKTRFNGTEVSRPTASDNTVTATEDTAYRFTATEFKFSGSDPSFTLASVKIVTLPELGTGVLTLDDATVSAGDTVTRAQLDNGEFIYDPPANGNSSASFTFKVSDGTSKASDGTRESVSPYTMTIDVTAVNDPPTARDNAVTTNENTDYTFTADNFNFLDDDTADTLASVKIGRLPGSGKGTLMLNGKPVSAHTAITIADLNASNLTYRPPTNVNSPDYASFTFKVSDGTTESISYTMTIHLAATASHSAVTPTEDTDYRFTVADFNFSGALTSVKIVTLPGKGVLKLINIPATSGVHVSNADLNAGRLIYSPPANANGADYADFTFTVDNSAAESVPYTMTIHLTAVNDPATGAPTIADPSLWVGQTLVASPGNIADMDGLSSPNYRYQWVQVDGGSETNILGATSTSYMPVSGDVGKKLRVKFTFTDDDRTTETLASPATLAVLAAANTRPTASNNAVATNEDTNYTFTAARFNFLDEDSVDTLASVKIVTPPEESSTGTLTLNGAAVSAGAVVTRAQLDASRLIYRPLANANGNSHASFTFSVSDGRYGSAAESVPYTMTIHVTAVDDPATGAPTIADPSLWVGQTLVASPGNIADVDGLNSPNYRYQWVQVDGGSETNILGATSTSYMPVPGDVGKKLRVKFTFTDDDGTTGTLASPATLAVLAAANTRPTASNNAVTIDEDTNYTFTATSFNFLDEDSVDTLASVKIVTPPESSTGALTLDGAAVSAGAVVTKAQLDASRLIYAPLANANGNSHASFTFSVSDGRYGSAAESVPYTMTIHVTAVDDPATGVPFIGQRAPRVDLTTLVADTGQISDMDGPISLNYRYQWVQVNGLTGTDIDGATSRLYKPVSGDVGQGLRVRVSFTDNGGTINTLTSATTLPVLAGANTPPTARDSEVTTRENTAYRFTTADFNFRDSDPGHSLDTVMLHSLSGYGTDFGLQYDGVNIVLTGTRRIRRAALDAGRLTYRSPANATGDPWASFTFSVGDGRDHSTSSYTMSIKIEANNPPTASDSEVTIYANRDYTFKAADFNFVDVDGEPINHIYTRTLPASDKGALRLNSARLSSAVTSAYRISKADLDTGQLIYRPLGGASGAGYTSFTFSVFDRPLADLASSPAYTMTINVTTINRPPVARASEVTATGDTAYPFTAVDFNFVDVNSSDALANVKIVTLPGASTGVLTLDDATVSAGDTVTRAQLDANDLIYDPPANANGASYASFTFEVSDGALYSALSYRMTIHVRAVNDPPTARDNTVTAIADGHYKFAAVDFNFADQNVGDTFTSLRIVTAPVAGFLQLNGLYLNDSATISKTDIDARGLTYQPRFNASVGSHTSFTFEVSDGALYSASSYRMTINIEANLVPTADNKTVTIDEDTAYTFTADDFNFRDRNPGHTLKLLSARALTIDRGFLQYNDVNITDLTTLVIHRAGLDAERLTYRPPANGNGADYATFSFKVSDGYHFSATSYITIHVTAVNDPPTGAPSTGEFAPRVGQVSSAHPGTIADVDGLSGPNYRYQWIQVDGVTETDIDQATSHRYTPVSGDLGKRLRVRASFTDDGGTTSTLTSPATLTVQEGANTPPTARDSEVTTIENTAYRFTTVDFNFLDSDPGDSLEVVRLYSLPGYGTDFGLQYDGVHITHTRRILRAALDAGRLTYRSPANATGDPWTSFTFRVGDGRNTSASDYTMNIKIRPNNRPTASDKAVTTNEDTAYPFTATNFNFADVDADTLASVTIVTLPSSGKGALELNGNPVSVNAIVTRVELDAMSLIYAPPANANGMDYADFTFTVNDSFEDSASASAMTIHVTAVNDPPTARASEVTIYADSDYTFKAADFNFVDVDGEPLSHIYTRTLPAPDKGALRLNGQPISDAISRINKADLDAGRFIYRSPSNASDAGYASFTFSVFDRPLADVADSPAYPMTINVTTVNHLPTARASEVTTKENTAYPFTATDFNFTDVNSSDALSNVKIVTLPGAGTGVLTLDNATVRADDTVTRAQLDANDLIYTPPANANGASYASFTFKVSDGTADSASSYTMTINIEANLVPTASNNAVTIDEDTNHTFTALDFNFIDGNPDHTLKWVIPRSLPTSGRGFLQYNGVDITTVGAVIRGAELDAERLTYAPPANANGASYASFTFQVSDGHAFSVEAYTMTIHVTAVNDPPTGAPKTSQRAPRVGEAVIAGPGNIADVDGLNSPDYSYQWVQVDGVSETDIDQATSRPYTPVSGDVGKSLRVRVSFTDDGGTTSTLTTRVSLPVLAGANTRPTARDSEVTTRKNTAYRFTTVDFNFLDSDPGDSLVTVRLHSLPGYGTDFGLQYDGVNIILTHRRRIPRAALDAGRLTYRSPANATGDPWTSFTFSVDDGRDTSASHYTMSIKIPNNPPTANDNAVTTNEDTAYPFTAANFNFAEVGADTLASVTIVTLPSSDQGALELNGDPVSVNAIVTRVELDAMYLIYTPLANANGMDYASFTFTVNDSSEDSASAMTIHVTAVNDPPTARASKVTIYADSDYTFKAADFNFVDVDGEPLSHIYTRTLPATDKGALRLNDQPISDAISRINKADLDAGRFIYRPPSKASGTGYASFTFSVFDGHPPAVVADSPAYPMTINVTTLNHTPTASASEVTAIEDTAYPFTADDFNLTDVNSSDVLSNVKIVTLPRHGTGVLTLDSATVRAGDTVTRVQLDANDLIYAPPANANGASYASFTFKVSDGHAFSTSSYPMTVHVTAVNDPPTGVPRISELAPRVGQVLIASDGNIADVDGLSSPDYRYQWVQVDGVSETDIDATSEATPHLYTPVSGDVGKSLRVRVRFTDDGGTTSTLTSPATLPVLGAGANTPPTARDSEVTTIENTAYTFTADDFNFVDSDPGHSLVTVRLRSLPKSGTGFGLQYDGVVLTYTRRISRAALDDGRLTYRSPANVTGDPWTSFTFSVSDGRDISSYYTMNIKIRPNNRPTASDKAVTTNEDTAYPFTATNFNFADVDDDTLASVRLVTLPSSDQGALKLNGDPVSVNAIVTRVELDAMSLIYAPPANANGMDYADFTFTVNDSFEDSASASAMTIHVTAVNDPPTARASEVTIYADSDYTFKAADFNFVDVDGEPLSHIYTRTLPAADKGALRLNDQLISDAISRINKADLDAGRFIYRPPSNASGAGYASFTFSVFDGHPAAVAGSLAYPMTINVTTVNHLPTASASEVTTTERTAYPFTATDFNFTDVNSSDVLSNVKIVTLPGLGTGVLTLDSATVRAGDTVTKAQLDANDLIYAPPANAYGAGSASFTFKVSDGTADSASSYTMTINIEANLVPTASNNAVTIDEDTAHTFTATDFNFRDGNPDHTLKVLLPRSLPTSGRGFLQYNGIDLTSAAFIIHGAGLDAERLTYRPPANANGASYASFTFQVSDGLATSVEAYTMTIHVTAVNDPPTGQPTISGEAQVGQTLTADTSDIEDVDGLVGVSYRYQWIRVDGAGTGTDISGATSRLYQTTVDDLGKTLRVKATFTDDGGNAGMLTSVATGTVGLPVVRIVASGAAVTEGTEATFTLTAAPAPTSDITVTVTVTDGGDFAGGGQTGERLVTIRAGNTTATLTVATVNDATDEPHGAITATVTRGTGYSAHNTLHTASAAINDDDDPSTGTPVVSVSGGMSVTEGTVATFTLTADPAPDSDITVTVMVTERGAFAVGGQTGTKMVTINTNGTATLTVTTFDDTSDESNGAITAAVTRGTGYSAHNTAHTASVTVNDNDDPSTGTPVVSVSGGPTVTEGTAATFTLTASPRPDSDISVTVTVTDSGFFASRGQTGTRMVTINTSGTATLTVTTLGDTIDEPNGAITAAVTRGTGYSAHNTAHTAPVTVNDDDATALTLTGPKGAITEGDTKAFTVNLNRGLVDGESLVAPLTLTGSATQGTDYTLDCASATGVACASLNSGTATVTFTGPNSGKTATSMTITLTALADNAAETAETVVIGLGTLRITGLDGVATTTDTLADFSIVDPTPVADFDLDLRSASEDAGTRNVTVNLSPAAPHAGITLTYNVGGTATAGNGNDFTIADSGSVTLLSGATSVNIPVLIADDNADESAETVLLTLTAGNGYTVGAKSVHTLTINDNDATVVTLTGPKGDVTEGDTKAFIVSLSRALVDGESLVAPLTLTGSAARGTDYTLDCAGATGVVCASLNSGSATVTFTGSSSATTATSMTITLTAAADTTAEPAETVVIGLGTLRITGLDGVATTTDTLADFSIVDPTPVADFDLALHSASEGAGTRNVTVNLSPAAPHAGITLTYNVGGTATAGSGNDFTIANSGSVTLPSGATSVNIPVLIVDDNADESAETVLLTLTAGNGYTVGAISVHTLTINDNDATVVTLTGPKGDVTEGDTKAFTVNLSRALVDGESLVAPLTLTGSAARGTDYTLDCAGATGVVCASLNSGSATVTFTGSSSATTATSMTITLTAAADTTAEPAETVVIGLGTLRITGLDGGATTTDTLADFSIVDPTPVADFNLALHSASEGAGTRNVTVNLSPAVPHAGITLTYNVGGTATAGSGNDFTIADSGSVTLPAGATSVNIPVLIADDNADESAETVLLTLTAGNGYTVGAKSVHTLTINDNDDPPKTIPVVSVSGGMAVTEGTAATFTLTADPAPDSDISVTVMVTDRGFFASRGQTGTRMVTINTSGTATLTVTTLGDTIDEPNGAITAAVTRGTGYSAHNTTHTASVTVNDDDATALTLTGPKGDVTEGDTKAFTVNLNRGLVDGESLVASLTLTGSATRGTDYTLDCASATGVACAGLNSGSATVTFAGSSSATTATSMTITLTAAADTTAEPAETVVIGLGTPTATGLGGGATPTATLADFSIVDPTPVAAFDLDLHSASEDAGTRNVTVNLSPAAPHAGITLTYSVGGTATAGGGNDFTIADSGSVTLTVGATSVNIPVLIADDNADESAETVLLTLTAGNGYTVGAISVHTLTINDNDATVVTLTGPKGNVTEGDTKAFTVSLDRGLVNGEILVAPLTLTGSATRGTDYTLDCASATGVACAGLNSGSATVTFAGSSSATTATSMTITLTAAPDTTAEPAETVVIGLGTPTATGLDGVATTTDTLADFSIVDPTPVAAFDLDLHSASEDAGTRNVTVNLSPAAPHAGITLTYSVGGTATAGGGNDFTIADSGSVTLTVGATSVNIPVLIADDNADESAETVLLTLTAGNGYTVGAISVHTLTINDNDATVVTLTGPKGNVTEGDTKAFTVSLDRGLVNGEILVAPLTLTGSATRGTDYTLDCASATGVACAGLNSGSATVTFAGSSSATTATSMTITLTAAPDTTAEPAETVVIGLGTPTATGLDGVATTTDTLADFSIVDPTPVAAFDLDLHSASEDAGTRNVTVNLSPAAPHAGITLTYSVGGTATAGSSNDFTIVNSGSVTLTVGAISVNIPVLIADDNADESAETVLLTLTPASGYTVGSTSVHTLTINDDDATALTLVGSTGNVTEGDTKEFTVSLDRALVDGEILVAPLTFTGTATRGTDYTLACASASDVTCANLNSGGATVTFTGSSSATTATSMTITLTAAADTTAEPTAETVVIGLGRPTATGLDGGATTTATLADFSIVDPTPVAAFDLDLRSVSEDAGTHNVTVNLSPAAPHAGITLTYSVGGTATAGSGNDFTIANSGSVTLPSGATSVNIPVLIADDNADENAETVLLTLTPASGYTVGATSVHTLTINDNDNPAKTTPVVSVSGGMLVTEGTAATFTLTADPAPDSDISVTVMVTDSGAFAVGGQTGTKMVTINTNGTATLTVTTLGDTIDEPNGAITAAVTGGTGYSAHNTTHTASVTVNDDDDPSTGTPVVSVSGGPAVTEGTAATFTLTADPAPDSDISVTVMVTDSGAFAVGGQTGTKMVTINTNGTATLTVTTLGDTTDEPTGAITAAVTGGTGYSAHNTTHTASVTVNDDDATALTLTGPKGDVTEGDTKAFTVNLNRGLVDGESLVAPLTLAGTATRGTDYTLDCASATGVACAGLNSGDATVTFTGSSSPTTATSMTITLTAAADTTAEPAETVVIGLGTPTPTGLDGGATTTDTLADFSIVDPTPVAAFDLDLHSASEDAGTHNVTVNLSPAAPHAGITLNYRVGGTATAGNGNDFTIANSGSVTLPLGATSVNIPVMIVDDNADESAETVLLTLTPASGYAVGSTNVHTLTINDNDDPSTGTPVVSVSGGAAVTEGADATFTLTATPAPAGAISVTVMVTDSGAFAGGGQTGTKTVTINTSGTAMLTVTTVNDTIDESNGAITAAVTNGTGYSAHNTAHTASVTINDNDSATGPPPANTPPAFGSASSVRVAENESAVLAVTAVEPDAPDGAVRYRLSGGADQARFLIDPETGALTFAGLPDYENPDDSAGNNEYIVTVRATSGAGERERSAEQTITVTVTDVYEIFLEPGTPVREAGLYQQGRTTITVTNTASTAASVTLPHPILDANGAPFRRLNIELADALSTPLPDQTEFGFDPDSRVDIDVSPAPKGGVELCLPVSGELRLAAGGQPLHARDFTSGTWRALPSADKGDQVCAAGVSTFSPFMASFSAAAASMERTLPAWLARFGRTVTDQVLEAVTDRLAAPRSPGMKVSLAGRALPIRGQDNAAREDRPAGNAGSLRANLAERGALDALRNWISHTGAEGDDLPHGAPGAGSRALQSWSPTGRDWISGTSFALTGEPRADGALLSVWGRGALTNFAGRDGDLALDGEAQTLLVGAERSWRGWTTGGVLGRSRVEGGYRSAAETGEIEATLTGVYPWAGRAVNDQVSAWAALGYGAGDLTLQPKDGDPIRADLSLALGAAGLRGEVLRPLEAGGLSLAVKGDVRFTRVASKAAGDTMVGRLMAAEADVWRVRAGVEGARSFMANDDAWATVTPSFEVGVRLDGGDAETGFGADVGGGVALVDPGRGVTLEMKARGLAAHEAEGFREWGASAALAWEPRPQSGRGLSLSLTQSWGASSSGGMDALLSRDTLVGLAASDTAPAGRRLEAELGYGMTVFGGDFTATPNAGLTLTEDGRDWRLGWRLTPAWPDGSGFEVNLDATRSETDDGTPVHAVTLRGALRF